MGAPLVRHYGEQGSTSDGGSPVKVGDYTARFVHSDDAKHRDTPVPLDTFKCQSIERSSFIKRICFDATNSYMIVLLNETYYHYCRIDKPTVDAFTAANSMGRFFNASIKGHFDCRAGYVPVY